MTTIKLGLGESGAAHNKKEGAFTEEEREKPTVWAAGPL